MARKTTSKTKNTKSNKKLKLSWWGRKSKNQKVLMVAGLISFVTFSGVMISSSFAASEQNFYFAYKFAYINDNAIPTKETKSDSIKKNADVVRIQNTGMINTWEENKTNEATDFYTNYVNKYAGRQARACIFARKVSGNPVVHLRLYDAYLNPYPFTDLRIWNMKVDKSDEYHKYCTPYSTLYRSNKISMNVQSLNSSGSSNGEGVFNVMWANIEVK